MNANKPPSCNVISFVNRYNYTSPRDLEEIMEDFEDMGYLSDKGKKFRMAFWEMFIKSKK